jgi:hypothetical protein
MFAHDEDNASMQDYEHLLGSYDMADLLDEIASADPPAYLRRVFAEGVAAPRLSLRFVHELAACAVVLDAVINAHDYPELEPELVADWRAHYGATLSPLRTVAAASLQRVLDADPPLTDAAAAAELKALAQRMAPN